MRGEPERKILSVEIMLAIILGALLHATWNALVRSAADKLLDSVLVIGVAGVLAGGLLPFMPLPAVASWPYLMASVVVHLAYFLFVGLAYRDAELGFAYPIMRGTAPALSAIGATLVLNESPLLLGWVGVFLISFGVLVLSFDSWRTGSLKTSSLVFALSNAIVIVIYTLVDGQGVRLSNNAISYIGWMFFLIAVFIVLASIVMHRGMVASLLRPNLVRSAVGGACVLGSYGIALWAMTRAPIALVAALRETSVIFAVIIGAYFLGERITGLRVLSVLMVTAGAVAIKIS
ncbi:MAG: EamA family transporter [Desulfomonile tiedjei]|nr:EamA family transporter [Desulfomonile tiedjei]